MRNAAKLLRAVVLPVGWRALRMLGEMVCQFYGCVIPPDRPLDLRVPPGHPERHAADLPPSPTERALWRQLGWRIPEAKEDNRTP
ncbi:DUF6059 family protein [Actinocrispum wychmicini]|uniref:Uncharacterized protein n=1 Tax=Actinocrispum wychmicini TaxID=1213861 RepID=A0A4R2JPJ4_9PSEU|nr:DUF6059 family protein [Actinocrispum wychmicini]TCO62083.1 hypothetical protein EV192_102220 [Actinocrispum wychmicini]